MVRIIAVSDLHGELGWLPEMLDRLAPDLLICAGDWGDPGTLTADRFRPILDRVHLLTIFGNHDDREMLGRLRNRDGTPALLAQGEARRFRRLVIAGISGIWAKTRLGSQLNRRWEAARRRNPDLTLEEWLDGRPMPPYVTDEDVRDLADALARRRVDILISHACPGGLADRIPTGSHGGQRCYREAFEVVRPRIMVCGHLHQFQRDERRDGRLALNTGFGGEKEGWLICWQGRHYEATPIAEPRPPEAAAAETLAPAAAAGEPAGAAPERQSERQARPAPRAPEPAGAARPHGDRQQQPRASQPEAARALGKGQHRGAGRATDTSQRRGGQPQPGVTASLAAAPPAAGLAGVRSAEAAPLQAPSSDPSSRKPRRPRRRRSRRPAAPAQMPAERAGEPQAAAPSAAAAAPAPAPSAAAAAPPSAGGDGRKEFAKSANTFSRRRRRRGGNRQKAPNLSTSSVS